MEGNRSNGAPSTPSSTTKTLSSSPPTNNSQVVAYTNLDTVRDAQGSIVRREFPAGFRFVPRDDELLQVYLHNKVLGRPLPMAKIKEVNIYDYNPHDLASMYEFEPDGKKECYFFTPRDRKYPNGTRPNRAAGKGYWKATGADKVIKHPKTKEILGYKKALVFYYGKPGKGEKTNWIQHEYRIEQSASPARLSKDDMKLDDWVLVRIYEKQPTDLKGKRNAEDDDEQIVSPESEVEQGDNTMSSARHANFHDVSFDIPTVHDEDINALLTQHPSTELVGIDELLADFTANPCHEWNICSDDITRASTAEAGYMFNTVGPIGSNYGMFQQMDFADYCNNYSKD